MLFRADLDAIAGEPRYALYGIEHADAGGSWSVPGSDAGSTRGSGSRSAARLLPTSSPARWVDLIRAATGAPDLRPELLGAQAFALTAAVATTFRSGTSFLAVTRPPNDAGGWGRGMNTALHAAHNLSTATPRNGSPSGCAMCSSRCGQCAEPCRRLAGDLGVIYRSGVIAEAAAVPTTPLVSSARPRQRAPHRWVELQRRRLSMLDLFDGRLTLLVGKDGTRWGSAVARARIDVPLAARQNAAMRCRRLPTPPPVERRSRPPFASCSITESASSTSPTGTTGTSARRPSASC